MLPRQPAGDRTIPSLVNAPRVVQTAQTAIILAAKLNNIELANVESTEVGL
jgi:hypothetical protein